VVATHLYGYDALRDELKMFADVMENDLAKQVKELSKSFLSKKAIEAVAPPKTYESNLIHHDLVQNSIHNLKPFCCPIFCHSSVVMYTSPPLQ